MGEKVFGITMKKILGRLEGYLITNERLQDTEKPSKYSYILRRSSENNALLPICIHLSVCGGGEGLGKGGGAWYK